ncbi:AarF/ABC1/UbiB kinase family protein [Myxococcota bacterium]|nr:AarF/ABC1/UbiB kinase family protein [Myxococcota bacterium]
MPTYQLHDLARARQILTVFARHGFGEVVSRIPLQGVPGLGRVQAEGAPFARRGAAERALEVLQELGPTFVKLGQVLSTRPDILPKDFLVAFESLQDRVPPFPFQQARETIEQELGEPLPALFAQFEPEPVASASIAQVHRARLPDGTPVAVKVRRPGIAETIRSDLNILHVLARAMEGAVDVGGLYTPQAIVQEFDTAISRELDFLQEAGNAEAFARLLAGVEGVAVPAVHRRLTSRRVLTLDFVEGVKLAQAAGEGLDLRRIMDRLVAATWQQVFVAGLFHGDPHPGNLLVDRDGVLHYLDFGVVGRLTREMQDHLVELFTALVFRDPERIARTLYRAGASDDRVNLRDLAREARDLIDRYGDLSLGEQPTGELVLDLVRAGARHHLALPGEYALLARATVTLDGIARDLVPDWNVMEEVKPWARRLMADRYRPERIGSDLAHLAYQASSLARDLPLQLDQLLLDLERGKLTVTARSPSVDRLTAAVGRSATRLLLGMGVSAFVVSAAILIATGSALRGFRWAEVLAGVALLGSLLTAGGLLGALAYDLWLADRLRSLPVGRILSALIRRAGKDRDAGDRPG